MKKTIKPRETYHVGNLAPLLLRAAREVLDEGGPTKLSLRAVADRVGVSATAVYHHYANRSELIGCLATDGFRELAETVDRVDPAAPHQGLRESALAYFEFARCNPELYQLMFGPEFTRGETIPELNVAREESHSALKRVIASVLDLEIDSAKVRRAALTSWTIVHGLSSLAIHGVLRSPDGASDDWLVDRALQGVADLSVPRQ